MNNNQIDKILGIDNEYLRTEEIKNLFKENKNNFYTRKQLLKIKLFFASILTITLLTLIFVGYSFNY